MRQRSPAPPSDPVPAADDFDWPPQADDLSVYDIGPDPWHALQDVASDTFAERHGDRSRRQTEAARLEAQRLAGVLAAVAVIAAVAGWVLYRAMTRPPAIERVHHAAPAAAPAPAPTARPPRLRIVATYPVEPVAPAADPAAPDLAAIPPADLAARDGSPADVRAPAGPLVVASPPGLPVAPATVADALAGVAGVAAPAAAVPPVAPDGPSVASATPSTSTAPSTMPAAAAVSGDASRSSDDSIRSLLQRYEAAYDQRDVRTAAALWPSLDQRALARAFAALDRQDVEFDRCHIEASDAKGSAVCVGTVRYVPSVGRAVERADRITWTFDLARSGEDWRIDGLTAQ